MTRIVFIYNFALVQVVRSFFCFVDDNPCHPPPVSIPSLHSPSSSHSTINGNPKTKFGPHNNSDDDEEEEEITPSPKMFKISLTQQKPPMLPSLRASSFSLL
jgi:hypothetical protein